MKHPAHTPIFAEGITIDTSYAVAAFIGAGGVIAFLYHALIAAKDREYALLLKSKENEFGLIIAEKERAIRDLDDSKKSYQEIATEAIKSAKDMANYVRIKEDKPPLLMVAPVVSESHSPSTAAQRETAAIATMRAEMVAIKKVMGQEPRKEPEHAVEGDKTSTFPAVKLAPDEPIRVTIVPAEDPLPVEVADTEKKKT